MPDIGIITGIIGAITGIAGMITGGWSLRQTQYFKSQDLRIERSRLINVTDVIILKAQNLLAEANQSRTYRFAAQGISQSGAMEKWKLSVEGYKSEIAALKSKQFEILTATVNKKINIESQIQKLHLIEQQINLIIEYLNKSMQEDDVARETLRKMKFGV